MHINKADPNNGPYYSLRDNERKEVAYYGKQKPHFTGPELYNGPCENYLDDINVACLNTDYAIQHN